MIDKPVFQVENPLKDRFTVSFGGGRASEKDIDIFGKCVHGGRYMLMQ